MNEALLAQCVDSGLAQARSTARATTTLTPEASRAEVMARARNSILNPAPPRLIMPSFKLLEPGEPPPMVSVETLAVCLALWAYDDAHSMWPFTPW